MEARARYGWDADFPSFQGTQPRVIRTTLQDFIRDAGPEQIRAWDDSIPKLQTEVREVLTRSYGAKTYEAILEYELPMQSRRTDAILLVAGGVVVLEFKGKSGPSQADIDQTAAYARDLRCYHRECSTIPVVPVVVPTRGRGLVGIEAGVQVAGPDAIHDIVGRLERDASSPPVPAIRFLSYDAYRPLPSLVQAARELFHSGTIRPIHRARAATEPAVHAVGNIIRSAAKTRSRHLVLLTGVPGAGKTLVGLQTVHAHFLDDLAIPRPNGKPTAPAVFLSGNGPLVEVLQYEFRSAGGGGRVFVRSVFDYVKTHSRPSAPVPPEHVLVFDEAQRAFDAEMVRKKHSRTAGFEGGRSEPEHIVEFAERIPEWCVVVGLIGGGQEIHVGEEAGLVQWRHAVERSPSPSSWTIHGPDHALSCFDGSGLRTESSALLNLDTEIRFHLAQDLHEFVGRLLDGTSPCEIAPIAAALETAGYHLRITRNLETAKGYLRERYHEDRDARFGLVASSKDRDLGRFGVLNDFQSTKSVRFGPWYSDNEDTPGEHSCRHLRDCVTEFGAQGLELDSALIAWGTDFMQVDRRWSNARARGYMPGAHVRDPFQLRKNAYRVLLTRGRDASVVFVPEIGDLDATHEWLCAAGFRTLDR